MRDQLQDSKRVKQFLQGARCEELPENKVTKEDEEPEP